jgi:hypothetical protein
VIVKRDKGDFVVHAAKFPKRDFCDGSGLDEGIA